MQWLPLIVIAQYPFEIQFLYYGFCLVVGFLGMGRVLGFWGYLFFSVLFSPILGFFVLMVSRKTKPPKTKETKITVNK